MISIKSFRQRQTSSYKKTFNKDTHIYIIRVGSGEPEKMYSTQDSTQSD